MMRRLHLATASLVIALLAAVGVAATGDDKLVAASSDDHLWFVIDQDRHDSRVDLCYHHRRAVNDDGPAMQVLMPLAREPEAMAAWGNQLWLVMPPVVKPGVAGVGPREVYTVTVDRNPVSSLYYTVPADHLAVVTSLPGQGDLASFVASANGPMALLLPFQRDVITPAPTPAPGSNPGSNPGSSPGGDPGSIPGGIPGDSPATGSPPGDTKEDETPPLTTPQLLRLIAGRWQRCSLPEDITARGPAHLGLGGDAGSLAYLLGRASSSAGEEQTVLDVGAGEEDDAGLVWRRSNLDLAPARVRGLHRIGPQVLAVVDYPRQQRVDLAYLRYSQHVPLASLDRPDGRWAVTGMLNGPRLLVVSPDETVSMSAIDPRKGDLGVMMAFVDPAIDMTVQLRVPLLVMTGVLAIALVAVLRPASRVPVRLPAPWSLLPLSTRVAALLLDLLPGALAAVLVLRVSPMDLRGLPLMTMTFDESVPYLFMAGVTIVHSTVSEVIWRRTLGKALLGATVLTETGSTPGRGRLILRNLLKGLVILFPVLSIVMMMNPNVQGLPGLASRTVVVRRHEGEGESGDKDR